MGISLHNHFDFELTDSRTGEKKAAAHAENVVTNYWYHYALSGLALDYSSSFGLGVALGSGTGTPSAADRELFNYVFTGMHKPDSGSSSSMYPTPSSNTLEKILDNGKHIGYKMTRVWVFPATSDYTGTLTEVGLVKNYYNKDSSSNRLLSHAMLKDAEGNEIAIAKTDLDILTVTVTAYLTVNMQWTNPIEYSTEFLYWLAYLFRFTSEYSYATACKDSDAYSQYMNRIRGILFITSIGSSLQAESSKDCAAVYSSSVAPKPTSSVLSTSELDTSCVTGITVSCANTRLGTAAGNDCVINGLGYFIGRGAIGYPQYPSLYLPFPNSDVFPDIHLSSLHVGTGDGVTTDFEPAVPLFVKNSDVVYVNGVAQVRDIDYTIDNNGTGRYDCSPGAIVTNAKITEPSSIYVPTDGAEANNVYSSNRTKVIYPFNGSNAHSVLNGITSNSVWSIGSPLTFELRDDQTIGHKVNNITIPNFGYNTSIFSKSDDVYFILEYSTDKETWNEVIRTLICSYTANTTFTFDTVEAKYWRIRSELASGAEPTIDQLRYAIFITPYIAYQTNGTCCMLHKGRGIVFTNPPAEGDIITMDATIDRPYKTENNVLDVAFEFKLSADL